MITLTKEQAEALKQATRAEEDAHLATELAAAQARVCLITATQAKRKVWTAIADAHGIDADASYDFNAATGALTPKESG